MSNITYAVLNCSIYGQYIKAYVLGGNCTFTLYSEKTKLRYTFRVRSRKNSEWYRVERLYGDDNTKDYRYIGCFKLDQHNLLSTKFDNYGPAESQIKYFLQVLYGSLKWPPTMYMYPSGRCARCGRLLTTPESIKTGFGPKCIKEV